MRPVTSLRRAGHRIRLADPGGFALVACLGAWGFMIAHAWQHAGHGLHHRMPPAAEAGHWVAMVVAMMFPLLRDPLRTVQFRSFPQRRAAATATFLGAYLLIWAAAGVPVVWLRAQPWTHAPLAVALAFALAAAWTLSRWHTWGARACHAKRALSPFGWRAWWDVAAYGGRVGVACVVTCWPLMVACTLTGHALAAMVVCAVVGLIDRLSFRPAPRRAAALVLSMSIWFAATGVYALASRPAHADAPAASPHEHCAP